MSITPRIDNGIVTVYSNNIDIDYWINILEKVSSDSYPFENVDRRPHQTMEIPALYDRRDSYASIEVRAMFYNILHISLIDFMKKNNMSKMEPLRSTITASKLLPNTPMNAHQDITDSRVDSFIAQLYINDDYDGGELFFPDHSYAYKPKAGDMAYYKMNDMHGVLETKSGLRYTIGYSLLGPYY